MKQLRYKLMAIITLVFVLAGLVGCGFSYMEEDLSPYVTFDKEMFDALSVTLDAKYDVTDEDVENLVRQNLISKKTPVNGSKTELSGTPGEGDTVNLWYSGMVENKDGEMTPIRDASSSSDFSNTPLWRVLGTGALRIPELETALMGINIEEYLATTKGTVEEGAIYFLSYYYKDLDADNRVVGSSSRYNGVNRVPAADMDEMLGEGFRTAFDSEIVGKTFDIANGTYHKLTIDGTFTEGAVKREYNIRICGQAKKDLRVEGVFVDDENAYAGKRVELYVQVFGFIDFDVPELNAETAVSLFKMSEDSEDPVADFYAQARAALMNSEERLTALQNAILPELKKCVTIHALPEKKVKETYKFYMDTAKEMYKEARADDMIDEFTEKFGEETMKSFDAFAVKLLQGTEGQTAEQAARRAAEDVVREDLYIFAVVKYSGMDLPDEEGINKEVDAYLQELMKQLGVTEEVIYEKYGERENFISDRYSANIMARLCDLLDEKEDGVNYCIVETD